jgi:hypothetical protein
VVGGGATAAPTDDQRWLVDHRGIYPGSLYCGNNVDGGLTVNNVEANFLGPAEPRIRRPLHPGFLHFGCGLDTQEARSRRPNRKGEFAPVRSASRSKAVRESARR